MTSVISSLRSRSRSARILNLSGVIPSSGEWLRAECGIALPVLERYYVLWMLHDKHNVWFCGGATAVKTRVLTCDITALVAFNNASPRP